MESDFRAILAGYAALIALVGTRIYPSAYAQGATDPCIRYQKITGGTGLHMQGSDGLDDAQVQVDIRGLTVASVIAVRDVLIGTHGTGGLLHPYRGIVGDTDFRLIRLVDGGDRGIRHEKPNDVDYYTASLDFRIWSRAA
jgi:hypothetical protein